MQSVDGITGFYLELQHVAEGELGPGVCSRALVGRCQGLEMTARLLKKSRRAVLRRGILEFPPENLCVNSRSALRISASLPFLRHELEEAAICFVGLLRKVLHWSAMHSEVRCFHDPANCPSSVLLSAQEKEVLLSRVWRR